MDLTVRLMAVRSCSVRTKREQTSTTISCHGRRIPACRERLPGTQRSGTGSGGPLVDGFDRRGGAPGGAAPLRHWGAGTPRKRSRRAASWHVTVRRPAPGASRRFIASVGAERHSLRNRIATQLGGNCRRGGGALAV